MHIAFQVYDLVDKHIRELDEDLKAFASEVDSEALALGLDAYETACGRLGIENGPALAAAARAAAAAARGGGGGGASGGGDGGGRGGGGRQKRKAAGGRGRKGAEADAAAGLAGVPPPDVAADASQPRYCLCQNVSYGDMVACDNIECPIEWFHFACVGLTEQPKGKWYCPECAPQFQAAQQKHGGGAAAAHAAAAGAAAGGGGGGKKGGRR
jgi:inhibitor of growth protein 4